MNANIKRIGLSPVGPIQSTAGTRSTVAHELWDEYTSGIDGRKPAHEFTAVEREKVKYKFYKREKVWNLVSSLTRSGLTYTVAIERI